MRRRRTLVILLSAVAVAARPRATAADPPSASQVRAAFVCNFTQFVGWPAEASAGGDGKFALGVLCGGANADPADDDFCNALTALAAGKTAAGGHAIRVVRVTAVDDAAACQAVYVPPSQDGRLDDLFAAVGSRAVLTVGDTDAFARAGGAIRFVPAGNKVRFEVHTPATRKANLRVSSKLLKVAIVADH